MQWKWTRKVVVGFDKICIVVGVRNQKVKTVEAESVMGQVKTIDTVVPRKDPRNKLLSIIATKTQQLY